MFTLSGAKHSFCSTNMFLRAIYTLHYIITTHQIPLYGGVNSHSYAKDREKALLMKELKGKNFILLSVDYALVHDTEKLIKFPQKMWSML
jgi:hypothetical protein